MLVPAIWREWFSQENKRTDYDSRRTWDSGLDAGSTPARSIICTEEGLNEVGRSPDGICRVCPKLFGVSKKIKVTTLYVAKVVYSVVIFML